MRTAHSSWGAGVPPTCPSDQATLLDQSPWTKPSLLNRWPLALEASQTVSPSPALPSPALPSVRPFTFWNDSRRDEHSVSWGARHPAASNHLPYCVCFRIIFQK